MTVANPLGLDRARLIDAAFAALLSGLAVYGFRTTFSGHEEMSVGLPAVAVGVLAGLVILRFRLSLLPGLGIAVAAFVAFAGPIALRSSTIGGFLTGPDTVRGLIDGGINGWVRLLTTVPPAGEAGNLLTVPYVAGFAGAVVTVLLAGLARRLPLCLLPPLGVLVLAILFGTEHPASLVLQGAAFAAASISWLALRNGGRRPVIGSTRSSGGVQARRLTSGVLVLSVAGAVGLVLGPHLSLGGTSDRYVLRDEIEPPFDPRVYASPLTAYRLYSGDEAPLHDKPVLAVTGLPEGARIRLGVLDDYDNLVWRATGDGTATAGSFRRVGARIPDSAAGQMAKVEIEVGELAGVWLPVVGSPDAVTFGGPREAELTASFRFNRPAEAAAVPLGLAKADRYVVETRLPPAPDRTALEKAALDSRFSAGTVEVDTEVAGLLADIVAKASAGSGSPHAQVAGVAAAFREGAYSDGGKTAPLVVAPGHSLVRLIRFLQAQQLVGNGEQYAAGMALVLRSQGIPARVVMGFAPPVTGARVEVRGDDAVAWVEVPFDGLGWVPFDPTPTKDRPPEPDLPPPPPDARAENQPPPPTTIPSPEVLSDDLDAEPSEPPIKRSAGGLPFFLRMLVTVAKIALVPLVFVVLPACAVLALKSRRRRRRRRTGPPAAKVAAAWTEVLDLSRDIGHPVPRRATRAEASRLIAASGAADLAGQADAVVFGGTDPTDAEAETVWRSVDALRTTMLGELPRVERLLASVSLTSLRSTR